MCDPYLAYLLRSFILRDGLTLIASEDPRVEEELDQFELLGELTSTLYFEYHEDLRESMVGKPTEE